MKFKIKWEYENHKHIKTVFISEELEQDDVLAVADDLEKTGRVMSLEFIADTGRYWKKKDLKQLVRKIEAKPDETELYFDGGFDRETGRAGAGAVLYYRLGKERYRHRWNERFDHFISNNEAEYAALYFALQKLTGFPLAAKKVIIKGDSQGVLMQLAGEWPVYDERLNRWLDRIEHLIEQLKIAPSFVPVSRNENKEADHLARQAVNGIKIESRQKTGD